MYSVKKLCNIKCKVINKIKTLRCKDKKFFARFKFVIGFTIKKKKNCLSKSDFIKNVFLKSNNNCGDGTRRIVKKTFQLIHIFI